MEEAYFLNWLEWLRRVTTRLSFSLLRAFSWCVAVGCEICFVAPYRMLRNTRWKAFAETLPLKLYADFPFRASISGSVRSFFSSY